MSHFVIDVESDAQAPGQGSIVCFGAVLVLDTSETFYGQIRPITDNYSEETLSVSGFTREQHKEFEEPSDVMCKFAEWIREINKRGRPVMVSDNPAFDWQWINYYFWNFYGDNPLGWSARRIGDMFCGFYKDAYYKWKKHRTTKHTHHPVDDAKGNAEALLYLKSQGFKIKL